MLSHHYSLQAETQKEVNYVIVLLYGITIPISILGNGMFVAVVTRFRKPPSNTEASLVQLSVCDILLSLMHIFYLAQELCQDTSWEAVDLAVNFLTQASFSTCILLMMCVALHQCHAATIAQGNTAPRCYISLQFSMVWLLALLSSIPDALIHWEEKQQGSYSPLEKQLGIFTFVVQVVLTFLLPVVVITACYTVILRALNRTAIRRKLYVSRMVVALLTAFYIFQLPRAVATSMEFIFPASVNLEFTYILSTSSCCINFMIYACFWRKFKNRTKELLLKSLFCKNLGVSSPAQNNSSFT